MFYTFGIFLCILIGLHNSESKICQPGVVRKGMSSSELFSYLTEECRYNKNTKPPVEKKPLNLNVKIYIYHLKASTHKYLDIEMQLLLEISWEDPRLKYNETETGIPVLIGEKYLLNSLWVPHAFVSNEKESSVMGPLRKDDLITISPSGFVIYTARLKTSLACKLELEKFPFDQQTCELILDSWRYNISELQLVWDDTSPSVLHDSDICLAEFFLINMHTHADQYPHESDNNTAYNYSSLILTFTLGREYGFYLMDYYVPSCLLVILSWMSFWLEPDSIPTRVQLGTSTMLTFLLLSWTGDAVPKVSQFKVNDIWELSCTAFIFLSLTEFAFVNTIDRREKEYIQLKKRTSKYILKYSVSSTPSVPQFRAHRRTSSCPSSPEIRRSYLPKYNRPSSKVIQELKEAEFGFRLKEKLARVKREQQEQEDLENAMTPQQVAKWIDSKSRFMFPTLFLCFNILYWSLIVFPLT